MRESLYYTTHTTPAGHFLLAATHRGLCYITLLENEQSAQDLLAEKFAEFSVTELSGFFEASTREIDTYLVGGGALHLPVDLIGGTPLQRMVWLEIARIPYGETISYTTLAERVGFPRAVRAVASACGANPVPLVIPCHRVLAKDGTLGGFSLGGIGVKEFLLSVEQRVKPAAVA